MAAIYQWFPLNEIIYTTTPYPAYSRDGLGFTISLHSVGLYPIFDDSLTVSNIAWGGTLQTVLLTAPIKDEALTVYNDIWGGTLITVYLSTPIMDDSIDVSCDITGGTLETILIKALMPDEGIVFDIELIEASLTTP